MKRINLLLICTLLASLPLAAQNKLFGQYQSRTDVRYVCITRTMLEAMQQDKQLSIGTYSLAPIADKIETILIIRSVTKGGLDRMENDRERLLRDNAYQPLLIRNLEGLSSLRLYRKEDCYPAEFILYQYDGKEAIYIVLTGLFSAAEINNIF